MNAKHIYSVLALTVLGFLGGWAIWGGLLMGFYESHSMVYEGLEREQPLLWAFILANLVSAVLLVYVLHQSRAHSLGKGLVTGLILGFLVTLMIDLYMYGSMNLMTITGYVVDVLVNTAFIGILGAIGGWILGMGSEADAETERAASI